MNPKILPFLALILFAAAPVMIGSAEQAKEAKEAKTETAKNDTKADGKTDGKSDDKKEAEADGSESPKRKLSSECLASEEVIADLEAREKRLKEREEKLKEREKEVAAQESSVKEELGKIDQKRAEVKAVHEKEMAEREEQVNKLIETFEGMSPKSAAQVIGEVDDELAVMALGKLTSVKAGKILANLKPEKSAHLSEMMAYGRTKPAGKETANGESTNRVPANSTGKR
jgi:flagellar motility protein MotE (MotC chaperone)